MEETLEKAIIAYDVMNIPEVSIYRPRYVKTNKDINYKGKKKTNV